jgi:hypothetical protein
VAFGSNAFPASAPLNKKRVRIARTLKKLHLAMQPLGENGFGGTARACYFIIFFLLCA